MTNILCVSYSNHPLFSMSVCQQLSCCFSKHWSCLLETFKVECLHWRGIAVCKNLYSALHNHRVIAHDLYFIKFSSFSFITLKQPHSVIKYSTKIIHLWTSFGMQHRVTTTRHVTELLPNPTSKHNTYAFVTIEVVWFIKCQLLLFHFVVKGLQWDVYKSSSEFLLSCEIWDGNICSFPHQNLYKWHQLWLWDASSTCCVNILLPNQYKWLIAVV